MKKLSFDNIKKHSLLEDEWLRPISARERINGSFDMLELLLLLL
jgi:hypothetical protein